MPMIFVEIHSMDELVPKNCSTQMVAIHEGSTITLLGTNGKPAGWIDVYTDIGPNFYRDRFIGHDAEQVFKNLKDQLNETEARYQKAINTIGALIHNSGGKIAIGLEDHENTYETSVERDTENMTWVFKAWPSVGDK